MAFVADWMKAAATAVAIETDRQANSQSIDQMLSDFGSKWDSSFQAIADDQREMSDQQAAALTQFRMVSKDGEGIVSAYRSESERSIIESRAQLEAIRETFKTELALQAPTTYWTEKEGSHQRAAARWAVGFGLATLSGATFVWSVWRFTAEPQIIAAQSGAFSPSYGAFLPTAGAAFLVVWILRILSRQLLANFALSSDAGERVAMVKTFLALMQRPDHVHEPDRILILSSLFRPALQSSEDATPPNWFDMLMQRVKKPD